MRFFLVILALIFTAPTQAHDHQNVQLNEWYKSLKNGANFPCCDGSDAFSVEDPDWEVTNDPENPYKVKLQDIWVTVPKWAVVSVNNKAGIAKVWPVFTNGKPDVLCFMPGSGDLSMDANWDACLKAILKWEGGNDDDPHDPGGRTSRGIIQREYDAYRQHKGLKVRDVWKATDDEVQDIYKTQYWQPHCPNLPDGVDLIYFNMAVNSGPVQGAKILQRTLGVNADGHIGILTMNAIRMKAVTADIPSLIKNFSEGCRTFYRGLKGYKYYGKGWMNRTNDIEQTANKLIKR